MNVKIEDIVKLIGLQLGIKKVKPESQLREDLGAESLDMQNIIMALEDKYRITIADEDATSVHTVSDFFNLVQARV